MKKKDIILFFGVILVIIVLIGGTVTLYKGHDNIDIENDNDSNNLLITSKLYYELEDRYIYTHDLDSIAFTYNNETKELKDWFKNDKTFLAKFLNTLEWKNTANDGGTSIYYDGGTKSFELDDVVVIVCKKITGTDGVYNNNIHIGKNLKYENDVCRMPTKK